ncbi:UNVERIFIED_CONTAM: hypothetical protein Sradi_6153300 [Sesamum radiatum]|uniref:DUF4283 domain-containing protein n=1 Tax=Sesamum radiatum TaxID=300843 RepID=A0AAW2K7R3_SESRA
MALRKLKHTEIPILVKLWHLLVKFWTDEGLSIVASGIGQPLYPDAITKACTRLDFARVCVMLNISSKLHKHIIILVPNEDGSEVPFKVDVEYEWIPSKCVTCMCLGHTIASCPMRKVPTRPPVTVYVQKHTKTPIPAPASSTEDTTSELVPPTTVDRMETGTSQISTEISKGKDVVIFNPFDAPTVDEDCVDDLEQGPTLCSPPGGSVC